MLKLKFKESGKSVWLVGPRVRLGSDKSCNVLVSGAEVQAHHLTLVIQDDQLTIEPVKGALTKINGHLVGKPSPLKLGDSLIVGSCELELIDPKQELGERKAQGGAGKSRPEKATIVASGRGSGWILQGNSRLRNRQYAINSEVSFGRSSECDLSFAYDRLSRRHATLKVVQGDLYIKDLGSSNGTFVNGKKIQQVRLQPGDVISVEDLSFTVIGPSSHPEEVLDEGYDDANMTVVHRAAPVEMPPRPMEARATQAAIPLVEHRITRSSSLYVWLALGVLMLVGFSWLLIR